MWYLEAAHVPWSLVVVVVTTLVVGWVYRRVSFLQLLPRDLLFTLEVRGGGGRKGGKREGMASPLWLAVYGLLCFELIVTFFLVFPLPHAVNKFLLEIVRLKRFVRGTRFAVQFIAVALVLAVYDSIRVRAELEAGKEERGGGSVERGK